MKIFALVASFFVSALAINHPELSDELFVHIQQDGKDPNAVLSRVRLRWDSIEYVALNK